MKAVNEDSVWTGRYRRGREDDRASKVTHTHQGSSYLGTIFWEEMAKVNCALGKGLKPSSPGRC